MKILITAGPTREPIDPVRYVSNRSSGKMGYELARAGVRGGHRVLLISGPTSLDVPDGVDFIAVQTAAEMYGAVEKFLMGQDAAIFAAAVSDYVPKVVAEEKLKKEAEAISLELVKSKDILGSARGVFGFTGFLVGFAAETGNLEENGRAKFLKKGCDLMVANDVSREDIGFDGDQNEVLLIGRDEVEFFPRTLKSALAEEIMRRLEQGSRANPVVRVPGGGR